MLLVKHNLPESVFLALCLFTVPSPQLWGECVFHKATVSVVGNCDPCPPARPPQPRIVTASHSPTT